MDEGRPPFDLADVLTQLRERGSPITGVTLGDLRDPATWRFDGRQFSLADVDDVVARIATLVVHDDPPSSARAPIPPDPPTQPAATTAFAQVAALLVESRAAHLTWRQAQRIPDAAAAKAALAQAASLRAAAAQLDPSRLAPAWREDGRTHPHQELSAFYAELLAR